MSQQLRIAGLVRESIVDGPGIRFAVFTQGCHHGCPGCHNPHSHDPQGGYDCSTASIMAEIEKNPLLTGVTFTGGEPLLQPKPLVALAEQVKANGLHLMIYTGYTLEELRDNPDPDVTTLLALCDVLVDGRYEQSLRDETLLFRGSRNQRMIDLIKTREQNTVICLPTEVNAGTH